MFKNIQYYQRVILLVWLGLSAGELLAATDCNQVTEIPVSECQSLLELYNSTNGANWTNKTGWNQTNMPCSWFGIACSGGYAYSINLNSNNLIGTLPNFNLPNLNSLDLRGNQLTGNIPNFNLPSLTELNLYSNHLIGNIPNFTNLPNLITLVLSSNQLSGNIPNFSNLPNLTELNLSSNQLSGNIPNFSNLPNLQSMLNLSSNQLSGSIPDFSNLSNLQGLYLSLNQLSGSIPNFSNLPNLVILYLYSNQLNGNIPNFSNVPKLAWIDLHSNQLSGNIPNFYPKLSLLHLYSNQLRGTIPNFSSFNLTNLATAYFQYNCGLTAYDSAQETILNQKDPNWKMLNSNCPTPTSNYEITVNKTGNGSGTISNGGTFAANTTINLTATPDANSDFVGWSPNPCANLFVMPSNNLICSATFTLKQFGLNVNKPSNGEVTGNGINCGSNCQGTYEINSKVTLTATPANGFEFSNWSGDCSGTSSSVTLTIDKDKNCSANFTQQKFTLTITKPANGTVLGNGINCGENCGETYDVNTQITLTANPNSGFVFSDWSGECSGTTSPLVLTMDRTKNCSANFAKIVSKTDCNEVTQIPITECQSLLELYNSTNGANWKNNTGWNKTNTPCSWYGVTCKVRHINKLDLNSNKLVGFLPNLNLPKLEILYLYSNQLSGSIPNFTNLFELGDIYLSDNQLSGSIPNFTGLPSLSLLELSGNKLSGNIPDFIELPYLSILHLGVNQLTGNIPNFNMHNLVTLDLSANRLSGSIPNFTKLPNLRWLFLEYNQLSGSVPNFVNLPNLTWLFLDFNQLSGVIPNFTSFNLSNLIYAHFHNNCGLTAYNAEQEAILNKKNPNWKTQNSTCLTSSISAGTPKVYISTDRTMYNPQSPNLAVFVSAEVISAQTTEENYDLYLYLKMNNGQILYWSNNQFVVDSTPLLKDIKIPNLRQWLRVIYLTLPSNVPDGNYLFGVMAVKNGNVVAEDSTSITYSSTNTESYTTPTDEIIELPSPTTLPELNMPNTAPISFAADVLSLEYPFFKKVSGALLFLNAADSLASGYNQIIADCSLTGGEKKLLIVTKLFDFIIQNSGLTASNTFIEVNTTDSVKNFMRVVADKDRLIADYSSITRATLNFKHTEWFSTFTFSRSLNVALDLIYEYSSKSTKNERVASFSVSSDSEYSLRDLKAGMYLLTAKDTTTGQVRRQFLNLDRAGSFDVGFNYREPARTTPEMPCQNITK